MTKGQRIGYKRVSGPDQNPDRQLVGIDLDRTYTDYVTGKNLIRKEFQAMVNFAREGDTIFVHSIDRIARNLTDLKSIIVSFNEKGISIKFVKENLDFSQGKEDSRSNLMLSILGSFAEFELSLINERLREGIASAKAKGIISGRRPSLTKEQQEEVRLAIANHERAEVLAKKFGVSRTTIYKCLKKDKEK